MVSAKSSFQVHGKLLVYTGSFEEEKHVPLTSDEARNSINEQLKKVRGIVMHNVQFRNTSQAHFGRLALHSHNHVSNYIK